MINCQGVTLFVNGHGPQAPLKNTAIARLHISFKSSYVDEYGHNELAIVETKRPKTKEEWATLLRQWADDIEKQPTAYDAVLTPWAEDSSNPRGSAHGGGVQ